MKVLMIGDVFGSPGVFAVKTLLPRLIETYGIGFVVANGENALDGRGISESIAKELFEAGVDVLTSGNHCNARKEVASFMDTDPRMLRPINYSDHLPGYGSTIVQSRCGKRFGVINAAGQIFMSGSQAPYDPVLKEIEKISKDSDVIVVDFHAEATSEKRMMGWFLDGKVAAVCGTHTHVQTADAQILPQGTAYISDLGLTGSHHSVIGLSVEVAYQRLIEKKPAAFKGGTQDIRLSGLLIELDTEKIGRAKSVTTIHESI
ncbi:MAG: YmdB family metallophosphoesterase [Bdellovibrionales bacterium]|nr:YmdB family metallophosphoesterase [Bdellovibrionales bacterium]